MIDGIMCILIGMVVGVLAIVAVTLIVLTGAFLEATKARREVCKCKKG